MKTDTISDRITSRMRELNLKNKDLVAATGASKGAVSQWVSGGGRPSFGYVASLANVLKVPEKWLLEGGALSSTKPFEIQDQIKSFRVPLISLLQAVHWSDAMNNSEVDAWVFTTGDMPDGVFAVPYRSDSMVNPSGEFSIPYGATVFVNPSRKPSNGDIVLAAPNGSSEAIIRKIVVEGPEFYLIPLNSKYSSIKISTLECIIGVCFRLQQDF
jgi:SOS-response transcriptional repressor LexA